MDSRLTRHKLLDTEANISNMANKRKTVEISDAAYRKAQAGALSLGLDRPSAYREDSENRRLVLAYGQRSQKLHGSIHKYTMDMRGAPGLPMYRARYCDAFTDLHESGAYRENLGAIIVPDFHGREELAKEFGFINVDDLLSEQALTAVNNCKAETVLSGSYDWSGYHDTFADAVSAKLEQIKVERPLVILCPTEALAMRLKAHPMGTVLLSEVKMVNHLKNSSLGLVAQGYGRICWELAMRTTCFSRLYPCSSQVDVERIVLALCNLSGVAIPAPWKHSTEHDNAAYDPTCPEWVLRGDEAEVDWDDLMAMHDFGMVPKECVDYFTRKCGPNELNKGFGLTVWDWSVAMGSDDTGEANWEAWQRGSLAIDPVELEEGSVMSIAGQGREYPHQFGCIQGYDPVEAGVAPGARLAFPAWFLAMAGASDTIFHYEISPEFRRTLEAMADAAWLVEWPRGGAPLRKRWKDKYRGGKPGWDTQFPEEWNCRPNRQSDPALSIMPATPPGLDGGRRWETDISTGFTFNYYPGPGRVRLVDDPGAGGDTERRVKARARRRPAEAIAEPPSDEAAKHARPRRVVTYSYGVADFPHRPAQSQAVAGPGAAGAEADALPGQSDGERR